MDPGIALFVCFFFFCVCVCVCVCVLGEGCISSI